MEPAKSAANTITARMLHSPQRIQPRLLHLAKPLINHPQAQLAKRGSEGIANRQIQCMSLLLQANRFVNLLAPAAQITDPVQSERLTASIANADRQMIRLP